MMRRIYRTTAGMLLLVFSASLMPASLLAQTPNPTPGNVTDTPADGTSNGTTNGATNSTAAPPNYTPPANTTLPQTNLNPQGYAPGAYPSSTTSSAVAFYNQLPGGSISSKIPTLVGAAFGGVLGAHFGIIGTLAGAVVGGVVGHFIGSHLAQSANPYAQPIDN